MAGEANNVNPGLLLLLIASILTVFSVFFTTIRVLRRYQRQALGWDDYTILPATILAIGRTITQIVSVPRGNGKHRSELSVDDYQFVNFCGWLTQLLLFPILGLIKTSICILVLRIKDTKGLRRVLSCVVLGLILTNLLPEVILLAECSPVDAYWKSESTKCWNPKVRIYSIYLQTAYSVATDLICSLLPVYVVWGLKMNICKRIGIVGLMSLGLISTAFALVRASSLGIVTTDLSWEYCWAAIWGDIELHLGIIATDLAVVWRMFYRLVGGGGTTRSNTPGHSRSALQYTPPKPSDLENLNGWKSENYIQISRDRRDSSPVSDNSKSPFGIQKEVDYTVADTNRLEEGRSYDIGDPRPTYELN